MNIEHREQYRDLIDAETWAYIDKVNSFYTDAPAQTSVVEQRAQYNAMCHQFHVAHPGGVHTTDSHIQADGHEIPIRTYQLNHSAPQIRMIYYHGGGFVVGNLDSHDDICAEFCAKTGFQVTAVDYRLAPEHTHPAAVEDALAAYHHLLQQDNTPVILAGDSAGGTLAAAVAHLTRDNEQPPLAQLLIYPWLGNQFDQGSYIEHAYAPMLTTADVKMYAHLVMGGKPDLGPDHFAPLADTDFTGLPRTFIFTAQCDPLADDGLHYYQRLQAAGVAVKYTCETGLIHGYLRARHSVERARDSFSRMVAALRSLRDEKGQD